MGFSGVNKTIPSGCGNKVFILNRKGTQERQFIDGCKPLTWLNQPSPQGLVLTTQISIRDIFKYILHDGSIPVDLQDWGNFPPVAELPTNL